MRKGRNSGQPARAGSLTRVSGFTRLVVPSFFHWISRTGNGRGWEAVVPYRIRGRFPGCPNHTLAGFAPGTVRRKLGTAPDNVLHLERNRLHGERHLGLGRRPAFKRMLESSGGTCEARHCLFPAGHPQPVGENPGIVGVAPGDSPKEGNRVVDQPFDQFVHPFLYWVSGKRMPTDRGYPFTTVDDGDCATVTSIRQSSRFLAPKTSNPIAHHRSLRRWRQGSGMPEFSRAG